MDIFQSDSEDDQEILEALRESGITVTETKKKPEKKSRIQILENIVIYKPDNELLHAINFENEPHEEALTGSLVPESNSESLFSFAAENLSEIEIEDTFVTGLFEDKQDNETQSIDTRSSPVIEIHEALIRLHESVVPIVADYPTSKSKIDISDTSTIVNVSADPVTLPEPAAAIVIPGTTETESATVNNGKSSIQVKRKKHAAPVEWQKNVTKIRRMRGESYEGYEMKNKKVTGNVKRSERQIGPTCKSKYCEKSDKRSCSKFRHNDRVSIFENFWKELDWHGKKLFVSSMVDKVPVKQRKAGDSQKREETCVYYLKLNDETYQVCKTMFMNTLGIKERMISKWISQAKSGITLTETNKKESNRGKKKSTEVLTSIGISQAEHLKKFFDDIPKLPSHNCRSTSTKQYLEPVFESKSHVYSVYKQKCADDNLKPISNCFFYNKFDELNLSISKPKKDRCDICCGFETNNVTKQVYDQHIQKKKAARLEKEADKSLALEGTITVLTVDLQSVKVCPKVQASAVYYKTKLCCHNFTVYNLATHEVTCYWWHECEGELQASNFASCLVDYIQEKVSKTIPLVIYSDGCTAQNRNSIMANALLNLAITENLVISQKYLEKGHTQMECDSVHSVIEIKLKNRDIFLPHEYVTLTKDAKKKTPKYAAKYLTHDFFKDYSQLQRYTSIRPGRKPGDPTVTDIRQLQYDPSGKIKFKLNFSDELQDLPIRWKPGNYTVCALYTDRIPLKPRKWKDLQDLKCILPKDCHSFYDNLPKTD